MDTSPTLRSLYRQYLDALPKLGVDAYSSSAAWTRHIKEWWARKGTEYAYQVRANALDLKHARFAKKEFMVDVLWEIDSKRTAQIQMALECEWSTNRAGILWDFRKLVCLKAPQKVMIFQASSRREPHSIEELAGAVRRCRIRQEPAEQYLLIRHRDHRPEPEQLIQLMRGYILDRNGLCKPLGEERRVIMP